MRRILPVLLSILGLAAAGLAAPAAHAATWSETASGTTEDITAIEYQSDTRFWYATGNGKIFRRVGAGFQQVFAKNGVVFKDIEFQGGTGQIGFAVGTNGEVVRSANGGATWTEIALSGGRQNNQTCTGPDQALGDAESIRFAGDSRAWIVAGGTQIFRTVNGATAANVGSSAAGWQYINKNADGTCKVGDDIDDTFPVPGSSSIYFISKDFGEVFFSSNALEGNTTAATKSGSAGNGFQLTRKVAGDPANPNRMWATVPEGANGSYFARTTDGWSSDQDWELADPDDSLITAEDVDFNGGTVLSAGLAGGILESIDGVNFYNDPTSGPLATNDWLATSLASGSNGAIGGRNGKLIVSTNVSTVPDIVAPTGTVSGPSTVTVGQPATYTATVADEAGGSGVDPNGFSWAAAGIPAATGNPVTLTFPSVGSYTLESTVKDKAGNTATADFSVFVSAPPAVVAPPIKTVPMTPITPVTKPKATTVSSSGTVAGGTVKLSAPSACIPVGSSFKATLSFKRSTKKGTKAVKVTTVDFTIDKKKRTTDKKAPFVKTVSVKALKAGSKHKVTARATIKVKKGKSPKKSVSVSFSVCR